MKILRGRVPFRRLKYVLKQPAVDVAASVLYNSECSGGRINLSQLGQIVVEELKRSYASYYDIQTVDDGTAWKALCSYHVRDSRYVLVKKAELWAAESHEYLYLWALDKLDLAAVDQIYQRVLEDGEPRVKPHSQHMNTFLTAVVLYDSADPQALAQVQKLKKRREYKLSLHGWMEFRIAAVDLSTVEITTNRSGRSLEKELKRMVARIISKYIGEEKNQ